MTDTFDDPAWHVITESSTYLYAASLRAAVQLGVAEHLADGPRPVSDLAELTGTHAPFLRRLLRYLATRGTFREDGDGRFHLTPYADVLRADAPNSVRAGVLTATAEPWWQSAAGL